MSFLASYEKAGIWPLQDHASDVPVELREVMHATRIVGTDPDEARYMADDLSTGDLNCAVLWRPASRGKRLPGWAFAWPAVTTKSGAPTTPSTGSGQGGPGGAVPSGLRTPSDGGAGQGVTGVKPIRKDDYEPDGRFERRRVKLPPGLDAVPAGTVGLVVAGTEEREEHPLFFPVTVAGPLVAVNFAGDPTRSSVVYDLLPDDTIDPERGAPLHTAWRVAKRPRGDCVPFGGRNVLAWQLAPSGRDANAGHGYVVDLGVSGGFVTTPVIPGVPDGPAQGPTTPGPAPGGETPGADAIEPGTPETPGPAGPPPPPPVLSPEQEERARQVERWTGEVFR